MSEILFFQKIVIQIPDSFEFKGISFYILPQTAFVMDESKQNTEKRQEDLFFNWAAFLLLSETLKVEKQDARLL